MAATEGGVAAPAGLLLAAQLVEAGELTLHLAPNITLRNQLNKNIFFNFSVSIYSPVPAMIRTYSRKLSIRDFEFF